MRRPRIKSITELEAECIVWNSKYPPGTLVKFWPMFMHDKQKPAQWETHTTAGAAYVLSGHTSVVPLTGKAGCVALSHCEPYPPMPNLRDIFATESQ